MTGPRYTIYELSLASAGEQVIDGPWSVLRFLDAIDGAGRIVPNARVFVRAERDKERAPLRLGQGFMAKGASRWIISWEGQGGVTATFGFAEDATRIDWDADPPSVVAVEEATLETLNNQSFVGFVSRGNAASNFSHAQLFNPAGSGRIFIVDRMLPFTTGAATLFQVGRFDTALTTEQTASGNKNFGAAAPIAELRDQNSTSSLIASLLLVFPAGGTGWLDFNPPIVLNAGQGLTVHPNVVDNDCFCSFQWREREG